MDQKISDFHLDHEGHWVADLECGHQQHVRHDPPWSMRPWVLSEETRKARLGTNLNCKRCDESATAVAESVRMACIEIARQNYEDAGIQGLCAEGRWEASLDAMRSADLSTVIEKAIQQYVKDTKKADF
jgi:hypothetical protein